MKKEVTSYKLRVTRGFTLIELIIYIGIVSIVLVASSYLILDIFGAQTKSFVVQEVQQNNRFVITKIAQDIRAAQGIVSLSADTLVLDMPLGDDITFYIDNIDKKITRQVGINPAVDITTDELEVSGSFSELSYNQRSKNIGINLTTSFKNPDNLADYDFSQTVEYTVELRGRR